MDRDDHTDHDYCLICYQPILGAYVEFSNGYTHRGDCAAEYQQQLDDNAQEEEFDEALVVQQNASDQPARKRR